MNFKIRAKGHKNVISKHKSTFEITKDKDLSLSGDCIIGLDIDKSMDDFPEEFKKKLANDNTKVIVELVTPNASDKIEGFGHNDLSLSHPTDIVCRKSTFVCSRTLMIKSNKGAIDLNRDLINDLANGESMDVNIKLI
ncbi:DUF371 domain-containing protein [Methanobrevibacter olleyae]|uniref:DUF371 domain-containing protein n=1 Tax=Methanobrevibacter olleyae TaxID=294671 RepID=A0A126QZG2_METOL|nr:DUF371 domain-containing protein [Methanobrevibacter olleyae]AMK15520.1 hypothetical protein YLM1_0963 [Methanobrevibacter olleyae]SFL37327.1 hypothetical protein SAMN02910297_00711 [Methanobrevibacter olleyae]